MEIEKVKGYGLAMSDLEGAWDPAFKAKLKKTSQKIILKQLSFLQKLQLFYWFGKEKRKAMGLKLSDIYAKGMRNKSFINQQLEYIAMFSALVKTLDKERALSIMYSVMDATAAEAMLQSSPEASVIKSFGDPMTFCSRYFEVLPEVSKKAGCHEMSISENSSDCFQFEVHYCVWLELAKKMDIPEACIPNCYADDVAYPAYFEQFGIKFSRRQTLAKGGSCCDFRFERM